MLSLRGGGGFAGQSSGNLRPSTHTPMDHINYVIKRADNTQMSVSAGRDESRTQNCTRFYYSNYFTIMALPLSFMI